MQTEELLGLQLVHRERRGEHARPGVRDAEQLEHALDAAVLPAAAVQREEGHVDVRLAHELVDAAGAGAEVDAGDVVTAALERRRHAVSRPEGDVALCAHAPHQNPDAPLRHVDHLAFYLA